eukprot:jgi/Phyca11/547329/estExt2_Genewise1Plus.C_PHYCAscaffold_240326
MCVVVFVAYCQMVPTLALLDVAAMKLSAKYAGDFGKQRLYSAFGYGVGGYIAGMLASAVGIECYLFLNVYDLSDDGATIVSVFVAVQTLSEIPFFFLASSMIKKFGTAVCITVVALAFFTRDMVYTYMEQPWYIVPVEMLHGVTFGLLLATMTIYLHDAAPKGASGTIIGLLSAVLRGVGAGTASLVGGVIYDDYGVETIWKIGAYGIVPAMLVLIAVFFYLARKQQVSTEELDENLIDDDEIHKIVV